jgi:hypothetical protein
LWNKLGALAVSSEAVNLDPGQALLPLVRAVAGEGAPGAAAAASRSGAE